MKRAVLRHKHTWRFSGTCVYVYTWSLDVRSRIYKRDSGHTPDLDRRFVRGAKRAIEKRAAPDFATFIIYPRRLTTISYIQDRIEMFDQWKADLFGRDAWHRLLK